MISSCQTRTACNEQESLYKRPTGAAEERRSSLIMAKSTEIDVLLFGCLEKDIQRVGNQIIKRSPECITTWRNMNSSEPRLKVLG